MKNTIMIGLVLILVLIVGCESKETTTIETDEGEVEVTVVDTGIDDWCPEGGEWQFTGTSEEGVVNAEWKIDKLMTSGNYAGLCHVIYTVTSPEGDIKMDYYFSEDGESGYIEMDMMGQKITQEWHSD